MAENPSVEWARDQLRQLYLWDVAGKQEIIRAATAKGFGLPADVFARPFPGSAPSQVTIVASEPMPPGMQLAPQQAPTVAPAVVPAVQAATAAATSPTPALLTRVLPWALSAAMAVGGAGMGGWLLAPRGTPPAAPVPTPAVATPAPTTPPKPVELQVQWKVGPDGKWQVVATPVPVQP